ncbi:acyl-CoA-binding protein [Oleiagrimonas sp.]|uniref:acyl-CoA-binding protein n=1 Tax=Oleiagrimonas sp. TaxID=2010330 RepID=UPI00261B9D3F|nr:acyl-CoA-binding protein [Oleiagrimonas sp.]MDA3913948.1 acyl-CoA-binding protein [Oleiagrimonas sp.]
MNNLNTQFHSAVKAVRNVSDRPDNDTLLHMYALYKQATEGDANGPRPGFFDFIGCSKREAWEKLSGTPSEDAMRGYVELVRGLGARI